MTGLFLYVSWHSVEAGAAVTEYRCHVGTDSDGPTCGELAELAAPEEYADALRALLGEYAGGVVWCPHCAGWLGGYLSEGDPPRG